jgi:GNAT superfamily N-acetyltransferase
MRCIGINQWAGVEPGIAAILSDLDKETTKARQTRNDRWNLLTASERFLRLVDDRFQKPKLYGVAPVKCFWRIGEWSLAEICPISFDDAKESGNFLIHLQSLYVVDTARGQGEGKRSIEEIKQMADDCGCGVTLFARSFAFSKDGRLPYAMQTFDELKKASLEEEWPIIYPPEWDIECLRSFYRECGFQNMCLYDSRVYQRPKTDDLPFESQFVYLPGSMDKHWRSQIEHRLNRGLCAFCNR